MTAVPKTLTLIPSQHTKAAATIVATGMSSSGGDRLTELYHAHNALKHRIHNTKFILYGNQLRAVQVLYVTGTFFVRLDRLRLHCS